ncbi:MAG TPA: hypothetical protein VHQ01_09030, partial [Pyrinomonadaceae bacterium]|nr:hypothetical protein [Pyrinomonadaceae bacterium]
MVILTAMSSASSQAVKPKKLLVVTTTAGFRHDIDTVETELASIARESGLFTLDFLHQPSGRPEAPKAVPPLKAGASAEEKKAFDEATWEYKAADSVFQGNDAIWYVTKLKKALEKLSPKLLAKYDGIIFASTSGELPIPDRAGFLKWIRS